MRVWLPNWDLSSIPEKVFNSERARRNNAKRITRSGGVIWTEHRPGYSRCRCPKCMDLRAVRKEEEAKKPRRPRGRPPKNQVGVSA